MHDYDFKSLNDKEFETLCIDLLSETYESRFERFKAGKDQGVDGRFFSNDKKESILQCKHWANTPNSTLIRSLKNKELPKVEALSPERYIVATSNHLSRKEKQEIMRDMHPFIKSESDIFGNEDLNDLIRNNESIEKRHYKLWMRSTNVIETILNKTTHERSEFVLKEIEENSHLYATTENHNKAIEILEEKNAIIITGEPGVGKTSLSEQMALQYIRLGYDFNCISDEIEEAEKVYRKEEKQIFYFDDFLGRNYLEAIDGNKPSRISTFIRRISKENNKKFILTSRSTILNQGKILSDEFDNTKIKKNEFELRISESPRIDKAKILYNHVWHSSLGEPYIEEIYKDKKYKKIIDHKNFNPRLISFILDSDRADTTSPEEYWEFIDSSLKNPSQIWSHAFDAQLDDYSRSLVLLVTLNRNRIAETQLSTAFQKLITGPNSIKGKGSGDFNINIRHLCGSFLQRTISSSTKESYIDLFNPSIGDFVIKRYANDTAFIKSAIMASISEKTVDTLSQITFSKFISKQAYSDIACSILDEISESPNTYTPKLISSLCSGLIKNTSITEKTKSKIKKCFSFILNSIPPYVFHDTLYVVNWLLEKNEIPFSSSLSYAQTVETSGITTGEIEELLKIHKNAHNKGEDCENLKKHIIRAVEGMLLEDVESICDEDDIISDLEASDYFEAEERVRERLYETVDELGIEWDVDVEEAVDYYDVTSRLEEKEDYQPDDDEPIRARDNTDEVDDLFERDI